MPYKDADRQRAAKRRYDQTKREVRGENWAIVCYPESLPSDWIDVLDNLHVPILISPLHDADLDADESQKKEHYHVLLMFESMKSLTQVKEISDRLNAPRPLKVDSKRGCARYLCHLDNPDKHQYPVEDVRCLGGADFLTIVNSSFDKYEVVSEIMQFVDSQGIYSYAQLMRYARDNNQKWFRALCDNCGWTIKEYCKSALWQKQDDDNRLAYRQIEEFGRSGGDE